MHYHAVFVSNLCVNITLMKKIKSTGAISSWTSEFSPLCLISELLCKIISQVAGFWFSVFLLLQEPVEVFCDDPSVENAAHSAVEKLNEIQTNGTKLALFQIQSASKVPDFTPPNSSLQLLLAIFQCTKGTWLMELQDIKLCNDYWEILARPVWVLWPFSTHWWCVCGVFEVWIRRRCSLYTAVHQQEDELPIREQ